MRGYIPEILILLVLEIKNKRPQNIKNMDHRRPENYHT